MGKGLGDDGKGWTKEREGEAERKGKQKGGGGRGTRLNYC